jgi:putative transposase
VSRTGCALKLLDARVQPWRWDDRRRLQRTVTHAHIMAPAHSSRWYRTLVAKKYDGSKARRRGRPSTRADLAALVVRMATENPTSGYTRIRGGLKSLGHDIARNTIKAILKDHGIEHIPHVFALGIAVGTVARL